ncbi:MAG: hypothetical protein WEE20_08465, partial [Bacteroidota bacterium]
SPDSATLGNIFLNLTFHQPESSMSSRAVVKDAGAFLGSLALAGYFGWSTADLIWGFWVLLSLHSISGRSTIPCDAEASFPDACAWGSLRGGA